MSTLKVNNLQVGQDGTAANNYTLYQPASPDGTVRLGYGVAGSVTDILTLKNSRLGIGTNDPVRALDVHGGGSTDIVRFTNDSGTSLTFGSYSGMTTLDVQSSTGFRFRSGGSSGQHFTIDSSGRVLLGTTTEGESNADDFTIATSAHTGMTIRSGTANRGNIYFSNGTSGESEYRGYVTYDHDGDKFKFGTANGDRLLIDSSGCVRVGNSHTQTTSGNTKRIALGAKASIWGWTSGNINGALTLADNYYWDGANNRAIEADEAAYLSLRSGSLRFGTTDSTPSAGGVTGLTEKLRITSDGKVCIGSASDEDLEFGTDATTILQLSHGSAPKLVLCRDDTSVTTNDYLGIIDFHSRDGGIKRVARIGARSGGNHGADDGPTDLVFHTMGDNTATTAEERLRIKYDGDVEPGADATQDLGSATKRWANIYSADLQLSNEGAANDVDGTWGKYTIQEGEDDLFLINKRNGKKYKFMLQEVN